MNVEEFDLVTLQAVEQIKDDLDLIAAGHAQVAIAAKEASETAAGISIQNANEATTQAGIATEKAQIATDKSVIATSKAQEASASAQNAATSEQSALASKNAAKASEDASKLSETNSSNSAAAALQAKTASETARDQSISAKNLSEQAKADAIAAKNDSVTAKNAAETAWDSFDDRYLGAKATDPVLDNDGNALQAGAVYWNTTFSEMRTWSGSAFILPAYQGNLDGGDPATLYGGTTNVDFGGVD